MIKLKSLLIESKDSDEYYYHVTLAPYVPLIKREGLKIGSRATVTNYTGHSRGKIFLCDSGGVSMWAYIIAEHAFHEHDDERFHEIALFRILKSKVPSIEIDKPGSIDSGGNAFYVTRDIPPEFLELIDHKFPS